jgi:hypothetical protein
MSARPALRAWMVAGTVLVLAAVVVALARPGSSRPLDPASTAPSGSKALASALAGFGVHVHRTSDLAQARGRIVVVSPRDYSRAQLRGLAAHGDLVIFGGVARTLRALGVAAHPLGDIGGVTASGCDWAGASAAGDVDLPAGTAVVTAPGVQSCYGGAVLRGTGWTSLGSGRLLRNDTVANAGVAALDVNAISADRTVRDVTWLLPGASAQGTRAAPTAWALFPDGARRAFVWLLVLGVLLVLWRGRRLGRVVTETLPVLVRAAEAVEGHGRLYLRAGARGRAAAVLREAACRRLIARVGLPRGTADPTVVSATVAARTGRPEAAVDAVLFGPPPSDDRALVELARALDDLEAAAGVRPAGADEKRHTHVR